MSNAGGRSLRSSSSRLGVSSSVDQLPSSSTTALSAQVPLPPVAPDGKRARPNARTAKDGEHSGRRLRSHASQIQGQRRLPCPVTAGSMTDVVDLVALGSSSFGPAGDAPSTGAKPSPLPRRLKLTLSSQSPSVEPDASSAAGLSQPVEGASVEGLSQRSASGARRVACAAADPRPTGLAAALELAHDKTPARLDTKKTPKVAHWHDLQPAELWKGKLFAALPAELLDLCVRNSSKPLTRL